MHSLRHATFDPGNQSGYSRLFQILLRASYAVAFVAVLGSTTAEGQTPPAAGIHFHHVHLNVTDPTATIAFYQKFFGANTVRYRGLSDGLFTEKSFILLSKVGTPPRSNLGTSLWHIGWAGVDGESEFAWRTKAGIGVQTPITKLGPDQYMYFWGPDREVIEVFTGSRNHRFEHFHLLASDADATARWFQQYFGFTWRSGVFGGNAMLVDNVNIYVLNRRRTGTPRPDAEPSEIGSPFPPTEGTAVDHVAFSVIDLKATFARLERAGATIVHRPARNSEYGFTSFFVRGPDGLLIEIVEEAPVPEGIWANAAHRPGR